MPSSTHIVPFAAISGMHDFLQATKTTLALPALQSWLSKQTLAPSDWLRLPEDSFSAPHELALLNTAWPSTASNGSEHAHTATPLSLAAWVAAQHGHALQAGQGWALMAPAHLHITTDSITLLNPAALGVSSAHNQQLRDAVLSLWAEDGLEIELLPNGVWLAQADWLHGLALPSIDKTINRDVRAWMPNFRQTQTLQRLQTEAQMLLYNHAANDERAAQRQPAVNALWVWGTGVTPTSPTAQASTPAHTIHVHDALRIAALQGDYYAWHSAWQTLDQELGQILSNASQQGEAVQLILCGDQQAVTLELHKPSLWSRLSQTVAQWRGQDPLLALLEQL